MSLVPPLSLWSVNITCGLNPLSCGRLLEAASNGAVLQSLIFCYVTLCQATLKVLLTRGDLEAGIHFKLSSVVIARW